MKLLLDTHAFLWFIADNPRLSAYEVFIPQQLEQNSIEILSVKLEHLVVVSTLPFHHRDPFDRLLIAQAMVERMPIVGIDKAFDAYPVTRLW